MAERQPDFLQSWRWERGEMSLEVTHDGPQEGSIEITACSSGEAYDAPADRNCQRVSYPAYRWKIICLLSPKEKARLIAALSAGEGT